MQGVSGVQQLTYATVLERTVPDFLTGVTDLDIVPDGGGGAVLYATSRSGSSVSVFAFGRIGAQGLLTSF